VFASLETELARVVRANLSPRFVAADRVLSGPLAPPEPADPPSVVISATSFNLNPDEAASPPRATRIAVDQSFSPNGAGPLALAHPPLAPLRSVEHQGALLRERDDFTVDYVNARLRLREPATSTLHVSYVTSQPLRVLSATRLRVEYRVDVFGTTVSGDQHVDTVMGMVAAALQANASAIDGLRGSTQEVVDLGLPGTPGRGAFCVFEVPSVVRGTQPALTQWRLEYAVDAWLLVVPLDEPIGVMRHIAAGVAWDDQLASVLLSASPPLLGQPVTIVLGVGPATAAALAERGVSTVNELGDAPVVGPASIDTAIARARTIRDHAHAFAHDLIGARPRVADPLGFFGLRLSNLQPIDLTGAGIGGATAATLLGHATAIIDNTTSTTLTVGDIVAPAPVLTSSLSGIE
jgi:hypothetical protein